MIKAMITTGQGYEIKTYRTLTVKEIMKICRHRYGRIMKNTLTTDNNGNEVVRWNFMFANVILYGDGVKTQFGYRTVK